MAKRRHMSGDDMNGSDDGIGGQGFGSKIFHFFNTIDEKLKKSKETEQMLRQRCDQMTKHCLKTNESIRQQNNELNEENRKLNQRVNQMDGQNRELMAKVDEQKTLMNRLLTEKSNEILKLKTDLDSNNNTLTAIKEDFDKRLNEMKESIEQKEKEIEFYKNTSIKENEDKIKLKSDNISLNKKLNAKMRSIEEVIERKTELVNEIDCLKTKHNEEMIDLETKHKKQIKDLEEKHTKDMSDLKERAEEYKGKYNKYKQRFSEAHNNYIRVKQQRDYFEKFNELNKRQLVANQDSLINIREMYGKGLRGTADIMETIKNLCEEHEKQIQTQIANQMIELKASVGIKKEEIKERPDGRVNCDRRDNIFKLLVV